MIEFYPESIYYTREAVEDKFNKGSLKRMEKQLFDFATRHKDDIIALAKEDEAEPSDETLLDNLKANVLSRGTLNPAATLADVYKEVSKEVWYQNETKKISADEVTEEWKALYSQKWQDARMFETFFLIEKRASDLVKLLRG